MMTEVNAVLAQGARHTADYRRERRHVRVPQGMSTLAQTNVSWSANAEVYFQSNCRAAQKSLATLQD